jgi:SAM-dependent methyltransferase
MFDNWISATEVFHLLRRIRREKLLRDKLTSKLYLRSASRIRATWSHTDSPEVHWWDIPAVRARWNLMVTGSPDTSFQDFLSVSHLQHCSHPRMLQGLSLGCGNGHNEIQWARTGAFSSIEAYDLSAQRIDAANRAIRDTAEASIVHYRVGDTAMLEFPRESFDVVIFENSLHHLAHLDLHLPRITSFLRPGGYLIANEFVGPTRFQWSARQLSTVNALLEVFPYDYTILYQGQYPKLKAIRPSKLAMWLSDPSEAVDSSNIVPLIQRHFRNVSVRGYGGPVLHLLFAGIAHHFVRPDPIAQRLLRLCFDAEDALLQTGELPHDFAVVVGQR